MTFVCLEGCSDCCGVIPMSEELVLKYVDKYQVEVLESKSAGGEIIVMTDDFKCIFLNRNTNRCTIYEDRPAVCKEYGLTDRLKCAYMKPSGRRRSPAMTKRVLRQINNQVNVTMRKLEKGELIRNVKSVKTNQS